MRDLKELRVEIDRIDREMVALFEERMGISKEVAEYKIATGKKILDKERENQKIEAVKALTHNDFNGHGVEELVQADHGYQPEAAVSADGGEGVGTPALYYGG